MGLWASYLGRQKEAVAAYREALRLDPNNVSAKYNLAVALLVETSLGGNGNELEAARNDLLRMLREGSRALAQYGLAGLLIVEGNADEAFERLADAVQHDSETVPQWARADNAWKACRSDPRFEAALSTPAAT